MYRFMTSLSQPKIPCLKIWFTTEPTVIHDSLIPAAAPKITIGYVPHLLNGYCLYVKKHLCQIYPKRNTEISKGDPIEFKTASMKLVYNVQAHYSLSLYRLIPCVLPDFAFISLYYF